MKQMSVVLVDWYDKNHRHFPWRETNHPYHIWVSEIMLQQTTTEAVIPYFEKFIQRFPTVQDLALASLDEVYKYWEGLGYYRRAKHLHESAKIIIEKYHGHFPSHYNDILSLKGVGPYTAGAISSIAFHKEEVAVDGNVLRIIARVEMLEENIAVPAVQKKITKIAKDLIQDVDPSSFNQGLMDLGATICRPRSPVCHQCPISFSCKSFANDQQNVLPILIKNIKRKDCHYITGIITYKNQLMCIQNPSGGLLENLYGFAQFQVESPYSFIEEFQKEYHAHLSIASHIKDIKHIFTHRTWYMHVYHFVLDEPLDFLYTLEQINHLALSTAHIKVLKAYLEYDIEKS